MMADERDPYEDWDAAYVLGALAPAERREYDAHLRTCTRCAQAVAELAGMPAMLSRVSPDRALELLEEEIPEPEPVPDVLPALLAAARRRRRSRRIWVGAVALAAAAVTALVLALPGALPSGPAPIPVALEATTDNPLTASVELTSEHWGTRLDMTCSYRADPGAEDAPPWRYVLTATSHDGTRTFVSSWEARPGDTVHTTGTIDVPVDDIATIEVRAADNGDVLLQGEVAGTT